MWKLIAHDCDTCQPDLPENKKKHNLEIFSKRYEMMVTITYYEAKNKWKIVQNGVQLFKVLNNRKEIKEKIELYCN